MRRQISQAIFILVGFSVLWLALRPHRNASTSTPHFPDFVKQGAENIIAGGGADDGPEIRFAISNIRNGQSYSATPPYITPGGDWTFFDCTLDDDPASMFTFGFEKPGNAEGFAAFAKAVMFVSSRDSGGRFASVFAHQFKQDVPPPARPEALSPVSLEMALFGENLSANLTDSPGGNWTAGKLFLQESGIDAEIFFNFDLADGIGRFAEKDQDYRSDIVYYVAEHFRDGPRTRRTPQEDPNLTSSGPGVQMIGTIGQSADCEFGFVGGGDLIWVAGSNPGADLRLVSLPDLNPTEVAKFDGVILVKPLDARAGRLIADERIQTTANAYSSDDEHRIWLIDRNTGTKKQINGPWTKTASLDSVSDDGRFIALSGPTTSASGKVQWVKYLMDLAAQSTVRAETMDTISGWMGEGDSTRAFVSKWSNDAGRMVVDSSIDVKTGTVQPIPADQIPVRLQVGGSPDGSCRFVVDAGKSFEVRKANGTIAGRFLFNPDDWHFATAEALQWIDSRYLLYAGQYPAVIDTRTMKMSYLPDEFTTVNHFEFSNDFRWAAVVKKNGINVGRIVQGAAVSQR